MGESFESANEKDHLKQIRRFEDGMLEAAGLLLKSWIDHRKEYCPEYYQASTTALRQKTFDDKLLDVYNV